MKTKNRKTSPKNPSNDRTPNTVETIDRDPIQPETTTRAEVQGEERKSVAWYERDGKILWERMRPSTREALKEFLERDDVVKALEVKRPEAPPKKLVGESLVTRGYRLVGQAESFIAQKSLKAPKDIADLAMLFDDEELEVVVPPTVRLLNQYGAEWVEKWGDWVELGVSLTTIQLSKFAMLKSLLDKEERKAKNRPEVVEIRREDPAPTPEKMKSEAVDVAQPETVEEKKADPTSQDVGSLEEQEASETLA